MAYTPGWRRLRWRRLGGADPSIAPSDATYLVQTPSATLTAEQAMSLLATGIVKNTTGTGVQSIAVAGTDYVYPAGVAGGQTIVGGTAASENLTLQSTSNATRGSVVVVDNLDVFRSGAGVTVTSSVRNTSNTASSSAYFVAQVAGGSAFDPGVRLQISGVTTFNLGLDNSDSDTLKASWDSGGDAGSNPVMSLASTGLMTLFQPGAPDENSATPAGLGFIVKRVSATYVAARNTDDNIEWFAGASAALVRVGAATNHSLSLEAGLTEGARITYNSGSPNLLVGTTTDVASTRFRVQATKTIASAAGAVWDGVDFIASTLTATGGVGIATATGVNFVVIRQPTISDDGSGTAVTNAATLYVADAPTVGGSVAITNAYALWVDAGRVRLDGDLLVGTATAVASSQLRVQADKTVASAAGAVWDAVDFVASTATITGGTGITTATGFNFVVIRQPTLTDASAVTVTNAATVYIANAPAAAGSVTITNAYALWVDAGKARFDGNGTHVFELPADATDPTGGGGAANGRIPVLIGGALRYLAYY